MRAADWILLGLCVLAVVAGPAMALQEYQSERRAASLAELTGEPPALDADFRGPWRLAMLAAVVGATIVGTLVALRIAWQPRVRAVTTRLLALLLGGIAALVVAFLVDARLLADATHAGRALVVAWAYPAAGIVAGGALLRLVEVEAAFGRKPLTST